MQAGSARQSKTPIQGKNNVGAATPGCWRVLEKCTLLQNSKHSGPEVSGKNREIKYKSKFGKSISRNFRPFLFLKRMFFCENIIIF